MNVNVSKPNSNAKTLSYEKCEDFTIKKINEIKKNQFLKDWCKEHSINYNTLTNFSNRKINKKTPLFMASILKAMGYEVSFHREIIFTVEKNTDQ